MKKIIVLVLFLVLLLGMVQGAFTEGQRESTKASKGELLVAGVYTTPVEEPYIGVIHEALLKAEEEFGIKYDHTEHVGSADFERVLREYCSRGYKLIFVDAYGNEEKARLVAKQYPDTMFMGASDLGPVDPNFGVFTAWIHEPTYLCGMLAGALTKEGMLPNSNPENIVGVVGGIKIPVVNIPVNAFVQGVLDTNPDAKVMVSYIGSFFDPPRAKEAAIAQLEAGADLLFADRYGVIEACQSKNAYAFGNMVDQYSLGPETVITSPTWDMWPTVKKVVPDVQNGNFEAMDYREWSMMAKGGAHLAPYHDFEDQIPEEVKEMIAKRIEEIKNGEFRVPIISTAAQPVK